MLRKLERTWVPPFTCMARPAASKFTRKRLGVFQLVRPSAQSYNYKTAFSQRRYNALMRYLLILPLLALLTGCGCDADLRGSWSPHSKELRVGQSFTPSVEFLGCGGTEPLSVVVTWTSEDSTVAAIDSRTGTTTGRSVGSTSIRGVSGKYGAIISIPVTVSQ